MSVGMGRGRHVLSDFWRVKWRSTDRLAESLTGHLPWDVCLVQVTRKKMLPLIEGPVRELSEECMSLPRMPLQHGLYHAYHYHAYTFSTYTRTKQITILTPPSAFLRKNA